VKIDRGASVATRPAMDDVADCTSMTQHTRDWDARFRAGDTPWEDDAVPPGVVELISEHAPAKSTILEIGCGRGTLALWLARQGHRVVACDISPEAVRQARLRAEAAAVDVRFLVVDVLADRPQLPPLDIVFTRGVVRIFTTNQARHRFATSVADYLPAGGLWLDISGNADTPDAPGDRDHLGLPRLTLANIALAVESSFEVLSIHRVMYGSEPGRTDFLAWAGAFQRRTH
jgi:methyl halide transferase